MPNSEHADTPITSVISQLVKPDRVQEYEGLDDSRWRTARSGSQRRGALVSVAFYVHSPSP